MTGTIRAPLAAVALSCALSLAATPVSVAVAQPLLWTFELQASTPVSAPQSRLFGPGATLAFGLEYPLLPQVLLGARVRGLAQLGGDPPTDPGREDPGLGTLASAAATLRIRPLGGAETLRSTGFFIDGAFGAGATGSDARPVVEVGIGYGFDTGDLVFAPVVRYLQVLQGDHPLSDDDARIAMLGFSLTGGEDRSKPPPVVPPPPPPPPPSDRDADGIEDADDACPDEPEDPDGYADEDGCPDPDNDEDGILDVVDTCPDEPEDFDEFDDTDGCPDPDNDHDGFLDEDDACPDEAEVVNGNLDDDGCPDEGLIEFKNNRIVLEERVLFDLERARVKRAGRPTLRAIVALQRQHPEWISIRIEGHADVRGNRSYNLSLSERRARNVREALVRLGIPGDKIAAHGFGASRPRDRRDVEAAHKRNRRVEFVVLARIPEPAEEEDPLAAPTADSEDAPIPASGEGDGTAESETAPATDGGQESGENSGADSPDDKERP